LLAFSRKQILQPVAFDLNTLVAETEKMLRRLIGEDVRLTTSLAPALGPVRADPGQIEQVLINLAVNARDAMPQGGRLTLETGNAELDEEYARTHPGVRPGPHVLLAVSDTGVGMDEATRAQIFEPFFTTKPPGRGTGLGLATVYGIVRQSNGHIQVHSEPGRGTTFTIYLPRLDRGSQRAGSRPGEYKLPRGTETVLLVEDEEGVRSLATLALQTLGYAVLQAADGSAALEVAQWHGGPLDLLVTDVVLPHLGGPQLAARLATQRPGLKVLFVSGYTDDAVVRHGVLHSDMAFLQKPYTPASLARKVREVLDAPPPGPEPGGA
jgi:two-component system cell cycle sensor histidine kinase/response regulator CckA